MDEEEEKKLLSNELKKEIKMKFLEDTDIPIEIATNKDVDYIRGDIGKIPSQNILLNLPNEERDASAIIEKEFVLDEDLRAYLAHELRKEGEEGTGLHFKSPNIDVGGSTDYDKEELAYLSARGNTPLGSMGINLNTDFTQNEDGEIFWRSPDGRWNATGYTDFDDLQQAGIGYNTDNLNINYNTDFGGNENLRGQWNPTPYTSIGGSTNFGKDQNIYAGVNYPIDKNWVVDALYRHTANQDEDDNYWGVGLRGNW